MALHFTPESLLFIAIFVIFARFDMVFTGLSPLLVLHVAPLLLPLHCCAGRCVEGERGREIGGHVQTCASDYRPDTRILHSQVFY